jgi:hypothetical protein
MSLTTAMENDIIELLFLNTGISNVGDSTGLRGSTAAGNFYVALYISNPGETGSAGTEASFGGYARVAVPRTTGGFTVGANADTVTNTAAIAFPECTGAPSQTITHWGLHRGPSSPGADLIIYGALSASKLVETGVTLQISAGNLSISVD